jgi:hypothetical protein
MPFHVGAAADEGNVVEIYDLDWSLSEKPTSS